MGVVYSDLLFDGTDLAEGGVAMGGPPTGYKWVLRDVHATLPGTWPYGAQGWGIYNLGGVELVACRPPAAVQGSAFDWQGRQIVEEGDSITFIALEFGWSVAVSGYQLTLP